MVIEGIDLTLGVEEEYQIVNPETRALDSNVRQFLENEAQFTPYSSLMPELMQSQIETDSSVRYSVHEARSEIIRMRRLFRKLAAEHGLAISTADTHPFADWSKQTFTSQALIMLKVIVKIFQRDQANMHKNGRADLRFTKQIQNKIS